jgi:LPXTG-site transpeptidase (sortase) family protein
MRRNLVAGLLIAAGLALIATTIPRLGLFPFGSAQVATQPIPAVGDPLSPPHQHAKSLPGTGSTSAGSNQVIAYISIPKIGVKNAPIYDRGVDGSGNMLIAKGYAVTHYSFSSPIGSGNAVLYGHDDIEGSVFGSLKDLKAGDEVDIQIGSGPPVAYHVTGRTIVPPTAVQILQPTNDVRLTLFTCWPNWVDTQRVVVTAVPNATA